MLSLFGLFLPALLLVLAPDLEADAREHHQDAPSETHEKGQGEGGMN